MTTIRGAIGRYPTGSFIALAIAWTWLFTLVGTVNLAFALVALFGPAFAGIVVTRIEGTYPELRSRITDWRHPVPWYLAAIAIPFGVAVVARVLLVLTGTPVEGIGGITPVEAVIFVLVVGEEIGWRSFLHSRLRPRMGVAVAGVATGVVWVVWHLPVYLAPDQGMAAFAAFAVWVVPLSVVMGLVAEGTRSSAVVATVMHGAANIATPIVLPGIDRPTWLVLGGIIYAACALGYLGVQRARRTTARAAQPSDRLASPQG